MEEIVIAEKILLFYIKKQFLNSKMCAVFNYRDLNKIPL